MQIQHKEEGGKGMFYIEENGNTLAELIYNLPTADKMIIEHTEVDDSLGGKGIGRQLVEASAEHARANNLKIIPLCTFAKSVFDRTPEWQDLLLNR